MNRGSRADNRGAKGSPLQADVLSLTVGARNHRWVYILALPSSERGVYQLSDELSLARAKVAELNTHGEGEGERDFP